MFFQQRYLRENRAFAGLTGLETIDLPNKGFLSGIELRLWGASPAGTDKPDVWLHDRITKIELIVNGSKVVKSLTGEQLLALMLYQKTPHFGHDMKNVNGVSSEEFFYINLGRHYHDMDYMLDLSRVNDPELRITHDFTLGTQNGWTNGIAMTAIPKYNIVCHLLRDSDVIPKGYIKSSEVYRFTSAAAKQENMMVARGPMYSNLYLQSWYASQGLGINLDHYEINLNSDDVIPARTTPQDLESEVVRKYGLFTMSQELYGKGGQAYPWPLEMAKYFGQIRHGTADVGLCLAVIWGNIATIPFKTVSTGAAATDEQQVDLTSIGTFPFSVAALPYFDPWDERTWIDSSKLGDFWVRVEEAAGAGANAVLKLLADEVVTAYE